MDVVKTKSHTVETRKKLSEMTRKRWATIKKNEPEKYAKIVEKIRITSTGRVGRRGKDHRWWKGGKYIDKRDGYVMIRMKDHPNARSDGYVLEHRLVMESIIGRYLEKHDDVNHINGNKSDNRPENLMLVKHYAHYQEMHCPKCQFKFITR